MLNRRRVRILRSLCVPDDQALTVLRLAAEHGVSERLIRYDLEAVSDWVRGRGASLRLDSRGGLYLHGAPDRILADLNALEGSDLVNRDYVLSPDERRHLIIVALLKDEGSVTVPKLANQLWVSRGTIYTDLERVEVWLSQHGLALDRRPHLGIRIIGSEFHHRLAAAAILVERFGPENLFRWFLERPDEHMRADHGLFSIADLRRAIQALQRVEENHGLALADDSLSVLALYLVVSRTRLLKGRPVESPTRTENSSTEAWIDQVAHALLNEVFPELCGGVREAAQPVSKGHVS